MHEMPARRVGGERAIEFRIARLGKEIADTHVGKRSRLLRHQRVERVQDFAVAHWVDELDLAELAQPFAFGAVAPPRRRRALGHIECFPVAGEMGQIGPARGHRPAQVPHRILLRADRFRHFFQIDEIVAQARIVLQATRNGFPQRHETLGVDPRGEIRCQHRRVVIAKFRAEPGELARKAGRTNRQREQEQNSARAVAPHHDGRPHTVAHADQALPGHQPIEALKNRAIGARLEGAPILLYRRQILMDGDANGAKGRSRRAGLRAVGGRRIDTEMRVKSCWDSLGHGRVSIWERSIEGLRPRDVHIRLTRPYSLKSR
jgi:hypothetical protein